MRPKASGSEGRLAQGAAPSHTGCMARSGNAAPGGTAGQRIDFISTAVHWVARRVRLASTAAGRHASPAECPSHLRDGWETVAQELACYIDATGRISTVPSMMVKWGHVFESLWIALILLPSNTQYRPT